MGCCVRHRALEVEVKPYTYNRSFVVYEAIDRREAPEKRKAKDSKCRLPFGFMARDHIRLPLLAAPGHRQHCQYRPARARVRALVIKAVGARVTCRMAILVTGGGGFVGLNW